MKYYISPKPKKYCIERAITNKMRINFSPFEVPEAILFIRSKFGFYFLTFLLRVQKSG